LYFLWYISKGGRKRKSILFPSHFNSTEVFFYKKPVAFWLLCYKTGTACDRILSMRSIELVLYAAIAAAIFIPMFLELAIFGKISKANKKNLFNKSLYRPGERVLIVGELVFYFKHSKNKLFNWGTLFLVTILFHIGGILTLIRGFQ